MKSAFSSVRLSPSGDWEMDRRFLTEPASDGEVDNDNLDARGGRFSSAGAGASSGIFSSMKPTRLGRCGGTKIVVLWSAAAWPAATTPRGGRRRCRGGGQSYFVNEQGARRRRRVSGVGRAARS